MRTHVSATAICLLAMAGCPSTTVYRTAEPVADGQWQVGGALGVGVLRDGEQQTRIPTGHIELSARRGVAEDLDVGLKLYTVGLEASATWKVAERGRWSFAVLPSVGGVRTSENPLTVEAINLFVAAGGVASRALSKRWTLGLGGFTGWGLYLPETGGSAQGGWLGAFAHGDARVWARWHITPELGVYRVVVGEVPVRGSAISLGASLRRDL